MKGHVPSHRPPDQERRLLNQAKRVQTGSDSGITPATLASLIASGKITRETSCDGKSRFRTYEYAEQVRPSLEEKYGKKYVSYPCPWCSGFHVASSRELAA